ncbi:regulator of chromosome condensation 1/beta-lactamase-inhibitor protein II [Ochromonadaceae sp. CCMP2298]|nr:regulator of chromosome condensation 1/beta-lactamase-inhibitor protein II [Ochromonadaceae sp. CCMP2298]
MLRSFCKPVIALQRAAAARYCSSVAGVSGGVSGGGGAAPLLLSRGLGVFGALGNGDGLQDAAAYQLVHAFAPTGVRAAAAGWGHSAVVDGTGQLWVFGRPYDFQNLLKIEKIGRISSTLARLVARSSNSALFGSAMGYFPAPVQVGGVGPVKGVSCSAGLTAALTETGEVYCFGLNRWSQCGLEVKDDIHVFQPIKVLGLPPSGCIQVDTGLQHCLALSVEGEVYAWGKGSKGQLGTGSLADKKQQSGLTRRVPLPPASHISAGFSHSAALCGGTLYVWGRAMGAEGGQKSFGAGAMQVCVDQPTPRAVQLPGGRRAVDLCCSHFHVVVLASDGTLWALGMGELDRGANPLPLQVQTDFHQGGRSLSQEQIQQRDGGQATETEVQVQEAEYVHVPKGYRMLKAHQRVGLVMNRNPSQSSGSGGDSSSSVSSSGSGSNSVGSGGNSGSSSGSSSDNGGGGGGSFPHQESFEVVLHGGEAYLLQMDLGDIALNPGVSAGAGAGAAAGGGLGAGYRLLDLASGWKHSLVLVQPL